MKHLERTEKKCGMKVAPELLTSFSSIVYGNTVPICYTFLFCYYFCCVKKLAQNFSMPWLSLIRTCNNVIKVMVKCFTGWPPFAHIIWTTLHTLFNPVSPSLTFGMTRTCTGACGLISLNASTFSSSYTMLEGISFAMILSKLSKLNENEYSVPQNRVQASLWDLHGWSSSISSGGGCFGSSFLICWWSNMAHKSKAAGKCIRNQL